MQNLIPAVKNFCSRKSRPKFTKFGEQVSIAQPPPNFVAIGQKVSEISAAKYLCSRKSDASYQAKCHRARSNDVREKSYNFYAFSILAPRGDLLCQSSPIWVVMYSKPPLSRCQISSPS